MVDVGIARNSIQVAVVLAGFVAGFLFVAGVYGLLFPNRLVERGISTVTSAYLVSFLCLSTGIIGLLLQRYIAGRFLNA